MWFWNLSTGLCSWVLKTIAFEEFEHKIPYLELTNKAIYHDILLPSPTPYKSFIPIPMPT